MARGDSFLPFIESRRPSLFELEELVDLYLVLFLFFLDFPKAAVDIITSCFLLFFSQLKETNCWSTINLLEY